MQVSNRIYIVLPIVRPSFPGPTAQGSGVFRTYPVLGSMRWQGGIARVVGTGMPRRSCRSLRST
jgi:hypothetical protein